jgi:hypothetical protein
MVDVDGRQYLITARHFVPSSIPSGVIEILHESRWLPLNFVQIPVEPPSIDIAVLAFSERLTVWQMPLSLGLVGSALSEEVFFLGFPLRLSMNSRTLNGGFPIPLVKHGIISYLPIDAPGDPFLVDGNNTRGLSGGPVIRIDNMKKPTVIGVVSAFLQDFEEVWQGVPQIGVTSPIGVTKTNSGLLVAYSIDYAIEAIRKKPIGYKLQ